MGAQIQSLPAPVGGWNARDAITDMAPTDAVSLVNWFPRTTECQLRFGYSNYSTGLPAQVETIFAYAGASANKLFGVSNGSIYDCTAGGAVGSAAVSGLTNSRFQYINDATAGGNYLFAVNGADKARYFDGTTWTADGGTFTITVADSSTWLDVTLHKQRIWAIQTGTLTAWYLPPSSIAGAAVKFPLAPFFQQGGTLACLETWTIDGGQGIDDYLVFMSTKGEVLIYQGTDPSSISTWQMVGLYRIGSPVGNRCLYKYQGDVLVISQDGVYPLSKAIQSERIDASIAVSAKISSAISDAVTSYGANFGWQLLNFPKENQLILNVPNGLGYQQQYVMNTINQSWCNFTGWAANCWELFNDQPYFGGNGVVGLAWNTNADNGGNIFSNGLQAFSKLGTNAQKRVTLMRPVFRSNGTPTIFAGINVDYDQSDNTAPLSFSAPTASGIWNVGLWNVAKWGSTALNIFKNWQGASGIGMAIAPRFKTASQGIDVRWDANDIVFEVAKGTFL